MTYRAGRQVCHSRGGLLVGKSAARVLVVTLTLVLAAAAFWVGTYLNQATPETMRAGVCHDSWPFRTRCGVATDGAGFVLHRVSDAIYWYPAALLILGVGGLIAWRLKGND